MLSALVEAGAQMPDNPKLTRALKAARRSLARNGDGISPQQYALALSNTSRSLDVIAEGLRWADQMRTSNQPPARILPILLEQNKRAAKLLEA